jgi:hypothetical protein
MLSPNRFALLVTLMDTEDTYASGNAPNSRGDVQPSSATFRPLTSHPGPASGDLLHNYNPDSPPSDDEQVPLYAANHPPPAYSLLPPSYNLLPSSHTLPSFPTTSDTLQRPAATGAASAPALEKPSKKVYTFEETLAWKRPTGPLQQLGKICAAFLTCGVGQSVLFQDVGNLVKAVLTKFPAYAPDLVDSPQFNQMLGRFINAVANVQLGMFLAWSHVGFL